VNQLKCVVLTIFFISSVASGEVYKCTGSNGNVSFSDKACPKEESEETITLNSKKNDWVTNLQSKKPSSIQITDVVRDNDNIIIKFKFKSIPDSSRFLRLASTLSGMNVVLIKIIKPKKSSLGHAEIKVSKKSSLLFSKLTNRNKKSKKDYSSSKCIKGTTKHRQNLTYQEVCNYGAKCPEEKYDKKAVMYCLEKNLSQCFENKAWKTGNELVGIPSKIKIGLFSESVSVKNGLKTSEACAFYD